MTTNEPTRDGKNRPVGNGMSGEDVTATERRECPECGGTRTLDGNTDQAIAAAWLDCTTCSAIPKQRLGVNEYGTPVSIHVCSSCGDEFTVCPPAGPNFGSGCLAPLCPSYDIDRDVDYLLAAGQRIVREVTDG